MANERITGRTILKDEWWKIKSDMWESKCLSDVTLISNTSHQFKAHKILLSAHSTFFSNMFMTMEGDDEISNVHLDLDPKQIEYCLKYMYKGYTDVPPAALVDVAATAKYLGVHTLAEQCLNLYMQRNEVTKDNCLLLWSVVGGIKDDSLITPVINVALAEFAELEDEDAILEMSDTSVAEYLSHPKLAVASQNQRLGAALRWVEHDHKERAKYVGMLLSTLPLSEMEVWYLKSAMKNKIIKSDPAAKQKIEVVIKEKTDGPKPQAKADKGDCSIGTSQTPAKITPATQYFVTTGIQTPQGNNFVPTDDIWAINIKDNYKLISLGKIGEHVPFGAKCCINNNSLYTCGLGDSRREIWKFSAEDRKSKACGSLLVGRQAHGIASIGDKIYVVGGYSMMSHKSISDIEEFDTIKGSSQSIMKLEHYETTKGKMYFNVECTAVADKKYLLVCGTWHGDDSNKRQILQLVSLDEKKTYSLILPRKNTFAVFGVLYWDGQCIVLAGDYTAVCSIDDIKNGHEDTVRYRDKYIAPNNRCGICLTQDGDVLVVGGHSQRGGSKYHLYRASVSDIINNTGSGWEGVTPPLQAGPLDLCWIRAYANGHLDI